MRILSRDLKEHIDEVVTIQGWLHKKRKMGGLNFINIRDRSGLTQVLIEDKDEVEKLRGMQIGTVLQIEGTVLKDDRAPGGAELHDPKLDIQVAVEAEPPIEIDKPLKHGSDNLDTLFEHRPIGLRNLQEAAVFKIQSTITRATRDFFYENEFTEIHTPKLLAEATEGGAEVFKLNYFGKEATLAQSPQFYKQMMVGVFERAFEIAPVYRAEPSATTRHMTEYTSIDGEMGFINLDELKDLLSRLLNTIVDRVWDEHETELKRFNQNKPMLKTEIPTISMSEIHEKYSKATGENSIGEKDLRPDEERWVCEYAKKNLDCEAVFVSEWPASEMKFYHKANEQNTDQADRVDLLFRGVEITTGSMRENRYDVVVQQLKDLAGGDPTDPGYQPLLNAMKYGMPPHGGFGMGLERVTQKIVGLNNIKEVTLFPRDLNRLAP
ncbi:aspartate--tRNA(Asn) ligase [Candidatus Saccharibacteria bacterium]|jgi:nondiscriminating aspartyl-tRNA synthetase|nr:aspartate--tRNA(Asn) ligase [Candidatus Saccharibacteria bacterium]MBP9131924.1 aspartate--tRNA(Asn) ligase [Candidatus Saccharibacteria bacterium]